MFGIFIKVSVYEFGINPLYCDSLPSYTWQCCFESTGIPLQTLQNKDLNLTLENNIRGGIGSIMGDRYVKSDDIKKLLYFDATILYAHSMVQPLTYVEIEMWHGHPDLYMNKLQEILKTSDDSYFGCFVPVDIKSSDNIKEKTKSFPFVPEKKIIPKEEYKVYMKKVKRKLYTKFKKIIWD